MEIIMKDYLIMLSEVAKRAAHLDLDSPTDDPKIKNWLIGTLFSKYNIIYRNFEFEVSHDKEFYVLLKMATQVQNLQPGFNPLPHTFFEESVPYKFYKPKNLGTALALCGIDPLKVDKNIEFRTSGYHGDYIFDFDYKTKLFNINNIKPNKQPSDRTATPYNPDSYVTNVGGLSMEVTVTR